jgi:MtN3 and saliva related transmembrane protein
MDIAAIVGYVAGICSTLTFIPQFLKIYQTKSSKDLSLGAFSVLVVATVLWLLYGFMIDSLPMIATNGTILVIVVGIVVLKLKYG